MEHPTIDILNVRIQNITEAELLANLKEGVLFTPNVDHVMKLQKDKGFYDAYQEADWVVCDSKVLLFCSRFTSTPFKEAIYDPGLSPAWWHRNPLAGAVSKNVGRGHSS